MTSTHSAPSWEPLSGSARSAALAVLREGPLSRTDLAERLGLTPSTVTRLIRPLVDSGLLVTRDKQRSPAAGRPSEPLDIAAESRSFAGVKVTRQRVYAVVTDLRARPLASVDVPLLSTDPDAVADTIARAVIAATTSAGSPALTAVGVGLGGNTTTLPGRVYSSFLDWEDVPLAEMVVERLQLPVVVANDVAALLRATQWFGSARDLSDFAMITIGAGVGYGCVIHDEPVEPPVALATISHLALDPAGPLCPEGHRGCATAMLSEASIARQLSAVVGRQVDFSDVLQQALAGDPAAHGIVTASARAVGMLAGYAAALTGCEVILLSGEGVGIAEDNLDAVREGMRAVLRGAADSVQLRIAHTPFEEWARGAAVRAIQTYVLGEYPSASSTPSGSSDSR